MEDLDLPVKTPCHTDLKRPALIWLFHEIEVRLWHQLEVGAADRSEVPTQLSPIGPKDPGPQCEGKSDSLLKSRGLSKDTEGMETVTEISVRKRPVLSLRWEPVAVDKTLSEWSLPSTPMPHRDFLGYRGPGFAGVEQAPVI
jgi:hypothetical protein